MALIVLGVIGFVLFYTYDINSITIKSKYLKWNFATGLVLVLIATVFTVKNCLDLVDKFSWSWLIVSLGFLGLLIYTLFFALPFDDTYVKQADVRKTYTEGMYALSRHPGVLWFAGFYISLYFSFGTSNLLMLAVVLTSMNFLYIVLQDVIIFPTVLSDYSQYKKATPFLVPNIKSTRRFIDSMIKKRKGKTL